MLARRFSSTDSSLLLLPAFVTPHKRMSCTSMQAHAHQCKEKHDHKLTHSRPATNATQQHPSRSAAHKALPIALCFHIRPVARPSFRQCCPSSSQTTSRNRDPLNHRNGYDADQYMTRGHHAVASRQQELPHKNKWKLMRRETITSSFHSQHHNTPFSRPCSTAPISTSNSDEPFLQHRNCNVFFCHLWQ